jgi:hypothetical protein
MAMARTKTDKLKMDAIRNLLNIEMSSEISKAFYSLRRVDERCPKEKSHRSPDGFSLQLYLRSGYPP